MSTTPEQATEESLTPSGGLEWERRMAPRVGAASIAGAGVILASLIVQVSALRVKTKNEADYLLAFNRHSSAYIAGALLQSLTFLLTGVVLWYLCTAAKRRRPEMPKIALLLAIVAPIAFAIVGAISPFVTKHYATMFAHGADHSNQHAKDLVSGSSVEVLQILSVLTGLAFVASMIMSNINSMRTGLINTFVGIIGIFGAVLFVIPFGPPQILMFFWLGSVGFIILDRWPGGRGPAWASDQAIKWPTAADRRMGIAPRAQSTEPSAQNGDEASAGAPVTRTSRKRKRKQGRKH